jgi:hypothetical protein
MDSSRFGDHESWLLKVRFVRFIYESRKLKNKSYFLDFRIWRFKGEFLFIYLLFIILNESYFLDFRIWRWE